MRRSKRHNLILSTAFAVAFAMPVATVTVIATAPSVEARVGFQLPMISEAPNVVQVVKDGDREGSGPRRTTGGSDSRNREGGFRFDDMANLGANPNGNGNGHGMGGNGRGNNGNGKGNGGSNGNGSNAGANNGGGNNGNGNSNGAGNNAGGNGNGNGAVGAGRQSAPNANAANAFRSNGVGNVTRGRSNRASADQRDDSEQRRDANRRDRGSKSTRSARPASSFGSRGGSDLAPDSSPRPRSRSRR